MKRRNIFFLIMVFITLSLSSCNQSLAETAIESDANHVLNEKSNDSPGVEIKVKIDEYMNRFMTEYISPDGIKVEKRVLEGESTEGGEILRYENSNGDVLRYRLNYYGELGRLEFNYYFIDVDIYCSILIEHYSSPVYIGETDILYRTFEEGISKNGSWYQYDNLNLTWLQADPLQMPYQSLTELNQLFDTSETVE